MSFILASNNSGKLREFQTLLPTYSIRPQSDFNIPSVEETGLSFVENALLKARHAAQHSHLAALADDSGLVVPALKGEPGIFSARYAGEHASSTENWQKLLATLAENPDLSRKAYFYCCLVFLRHTSDPTPLITEGYWHGEIATTPQGEHGFGYDPVFFIPDLGLTAAQLSSDEKNKRSHRGQALRELITRLSYSHCT